MTDYGKIRQAGEQADRDQTNPYPNGTSSARAWQAGHADAHGTETRSEAPPMSSSDEIKAALREQNAPRFIDVTPTWEDLMPAFFAILENGTDTGKDLARAELTRLARMADAINAREKAQQARRAALAGYEDDPTDHD